jgi:katanin p60 ATPase-containing subunit A1
MGVDFSGSDYAFFEKALKNARVQEDRGKPTEAAALYRQCADHLTRYAAAFSVTSIRSKWLAQARAYRELADRLEKGLVPSPVTEPSGPSPEQYEQEIAALVSTSRITWDDIGGLEETKREIKMAYGLSVASPPEGVKVPTEKTMLLYGPPGTGKTLLAAATSNGLDATFFDAKASALLSKFYGESSRLISALYAAAHRRAPAVVFLDELDKLLGGRDGGESSADQRVLSTFQTEVDGLASKDAPNYVLTIGATNLPWNLGDAILSRFGRRVYVPLPDAPARESIFRIHLEKKGYRVQIPYAELVRRSAGYSGREIEHIVTEAVKHMAHEVNPDLVSKVDEGRASVEKYQLRVRPLQTSDFDLAFRQIRPLTTESDLKLYREWEQRME